ncbi:MAG TPA: MFS transporter [Stellaceae bacterium]|nr:MFS transporter [Stellaceae bacterium]
MFFSASGGTRQHNAAVAAAAIASPAIDPSGPRGLGLLAIPDFRRLWLIGLVVFAARWLEMIVVGVFVYQHTGSAFDVALMTLLRALPMALFGALIGAFADRIERRTALIAVLLSMFVTALTLAVLAHAGRLAVWHLAVASFINGIAWAADNPVRRVMIGDSVGSESMGAAMSLDVGANNASRMLGPTIGGLLLAGVGIGGAFSVSMLCYLAALVAALRLSRRSTIAATGGSSVLARLIEGLMLVRHDRRLIGILTITVIYNVFGWPFTSMIPVIGQDNLGLGPSGIGVLASMDGVGAFCGAVAIALFAKPRHYAALYIGGVLTYLVLVIVFALAPHAGPAGGALLFTGLANAGFSIMQATLVYLSAPVEMRSRIYGVLSVCIGVGPLGFLYLGLLAELVGASSATIMTALQGLLAMALTWRWWGVLLRSA